jgi:hypothetical protein
MLNSQMLNKKEILRQLDEAWAIMPHINEKCHGGSTLKGDDNTDDFNALMTLFAISCDSMNIRLQKICTFALQ